MNVIGFDIGGTKCATILGKVDSHGNMEIVEKMVFPTKKGPEATIEAIFSNSESLMRKHGLSTSDIAGIGISCGGPLDSKRGIIQSPPNLPGWDDVHIVEMTENRFGIKTVVQNDANACAVAEWKFGAGKGYDNVIFFTFGTGMGAGLILDGKLYSGTNDLGGEVGHMRLSDSGPVGFGKAGSFEGWCSGGGIAQIGQTMAREKLQMGDKTGYCSTLDQLDTVTAKSIAEAAYAGDETAKEVYRLSGEYLGRALSILIDVLNPEVLILGSIYGRAKDLIEPAMRSVIEKEAIPLAARSCKIVPAALSENIGDMAALALAVEASNKL